jgi:hypothetical protein
MYKRLPIQVVIVNQVVADVADALAAPEVAMSRQNCCHQYFSPKLPVPHSPLIDLFNRGRQDIITSHNVSPIFRQPLDF